MALKAIVKDIDINASKENVWHALFNDATYKIWAAEFMEGSYVETDWQEGSEAKFLGADGNGIFGIITKNVPGEILEITYEGLIGNNMIDRDSDNAKVFKGSTETYTLSENNGQIHLHVDAVMDEQWFDEMNTAWDRAMLKIKELAETH